MHSLPLYCLTISFPNGLIKSHLSWNCCGNSCILPSIVCAVNLKIRFIVYSISLFLQYTNPSRFSLSDENGKFLLLPRLSITFINLFSLPCNALPSAISKDSLSSETHITMPMWACQLFPLFQNTNHPLS